MFVGSAQQPLFLFGPLNNLELLHRFDGGLNANAMSQGKGVGEVRIDRTRNIRDDDGGSDFTKDKGRDGRWSALFNRPCGLLLLVLLVELRKFDTPLWHAPYGRIV